MDEGQRTTLLHAKFGQKARSWFEAWLNKYLGNRLVARAVIRYGCTNVAVVTSILEAIATEKVEEAKKRKLQDEAHGAGEPVWKLKLNAHLARKALRDGERLARKEQTGNIKWDWLTRHEQDLIEDFHARRLHVRVGQANKNIGMASRGRTISDFNRDKTCVVTRPSRCAHTCELCRDLRSRWAKQWCCRAYC